MSATFAENPAFMGSLIGQLDRRLGEVVGELADECRQQISTPYPPASQPFTPPHRRSGGLSEAVFSTRLDELDWAYGYRHVAADPGRPDANRERLGIWMELGTGVHRHSPDGDGGITPSISPVVRTSVEPRPVLLPVLVQIGPRVVEQKFGGVL